MKKFLNILVIIGTALLFGMAVILLGILLDSLK